MPSWKDEYLRALQERDKKEKSNKNFYETYTKLADRTAVLHVAPTELASKNKYQNLSPLEDRKQNRDKDISGSQVSAEAIARMRRDLSEAQRSRELMETRLQDVTEELKSQKIQISLDSKRIGELTKEKAVLTTRSKDRDEELRGKSKLLEDVHDETVSLTLQLNMAEEQSQKLRYENAELVDRWMARMGQEADAMNSTSKFSS